MYCRNCGNLIDDGSAFCPHCGASQNVQNQTAHNTQNTQYQYAQHSYPSEKTNVLAIVGFILAFFCTIAGLVCSIIAYKNAPQYGGNGKGLALAGIIISGIAIAISVLTVITVIAVSGAFLGEFLS